MNAASFIVRPVGGQPLAGQVGLADGRGELRSGRGSRSRAPPTRWCCRRAASPIWSATRWRPNGSRRSRRTEAGEPARSHHMLRSCIAFAVTLAAFALACAAGARADARGDARRPVGGRRGARLHGHRRRGANGAVTLRVEVRRRRTTSSRAARRCRTPSRTPGLHSIDVRRRPTPAGDAASAFFQHLVHHPLTPQRPTSSTSIVYDARATASIRSIRTTTRSRPSTRTSCRSSPSSPSIARPESLALTPEGKLWVVHQDDYAVAVDRSRTASSSSAAFACPTRRSRSALAMSPDRRRRLCQPDGARKAAQARSRRPARCSARRPSARGRAGIAVSHDGKDVYVTRFISPDTGGEVVKVDAAAMTVATRIVLKLDAETMDSDQAGARPSQLPVLRRAHARRAAGVGSRGRRTTSCAASCATGESLTHDTTVRPLAAVIDAHGGPGDLRQSRRSRRSQPARRTSSSARSATSRSSRWRARTASRFATSTGRRRCSRRSATSARSRGPPCWRRMGACSCRARSAATSSSTTCRRC